MSIDVVYATASFPKDWHQALKFGAIRYVRYHCGFDENSEYVLKLGKHETLAAMSYIPEDLTDDAYKVYIKRGNYVKAEIRIVKVGVKLPTLTDHFKLLPIYIETRKSPERLKIFEVIKHIDNLVKQNKHQEALDYMTGFPMTPDILHFTRKCYNLLGKRTTAIETTLDERRGLKGWFQCDALCQSQFELSAAYFYMGNRNLAYYHQDQLIHDRQLPKYLRNGYLRNICNFYKDQMLAIIGEPESRVKIYDQLPHPADYQLMNISLLAFDTDMADWLHFPGTVALGLARTVNYLVKNGAYISMHGDKKIRTQTYLVWFDKDFQVIKYLKIRLAIEYYKQRYPMIEDLEDMRIFRKPSGDIGFMATGIDTHAHQSHQMLMGSFNEAAEINELLLLHYADWRYQKNWLAFSHRGQVLIIYKYDPFTLIQVTNEMWGQTEVYLETYSNLAVGFLRGSSAPIDCRSWLAGTKYSETEWLMTVHSSVRKENGRIAYIHKFLMLTSDFKIYKVSRYYKLTPELMEYSMGCILIADKLIVSYSQNDRLGCLAILTRDQVLACFD